MAKAPCKGRGRRGQRTPTCEMRMSANCSFIEITVSEPRDSSSTSSYGSCCGVKKKEKKQSARFSACVVCVVSGVFARACVRACVQLPWRLGAGGRTTA